MAPLWPVWQQMYVSQAAGNSLVTKQPTVVDRNRLIQEANGVDTNVNWGVIWRGVSRHRYTEPPVFDY